MEHDSRVRMVFSHHTAEEFAADPAPLSVGMHQQIVNVCRHLTVVKHGDQTAQTVCFPGGVHRRKSTHRTRQPLRILRRLPIDGSKKRLQLFLRDIFSVRVFDQSYFSLFLRKGGNAVRIARTSAPCLFCMAKSLRVSKHIGRNARSERKGCRRRKIIIKKDAGCNLQLATVYERRQLPILPGD